MLSDLVFLTTRVGYKGRQLQLTEHVPVQSAVSGTSSKLLAAPGSEGFSGYYHERSGLFLTEADFAVVLFSSGILLR